jgi:hypothetical protein
MDFMAGVGWGWEDGKTEMLFQTGKNVLPVIAGMFTDYVLVFLRQAIM